MDMPFGVMQLGFKPLRPSVNRLRECGPKMLQLLSMTFQPVPPHMPQEPKALPKTPHHMSQLPASPVSHIVEGSTIAVLLSEGTLSTPFEAAYWWYQLVPAETPAPKRPVARTFRLPAKRSVHRK